MLRSGAELIFYAERITSFQASRTTGRVTGLAWLDGDSGVRLYHVVPEDISAVIESDELEDYPKVPPTGTQSSVAPTTDEAGSEPAPNPTVIDPGDEQNDPEFYFD